ncbi:MAG: hypothetical protein J5827_05015, partial [Oscillospiraceae bacterium]|nr:hypothetical protein [Oscillospiraceae bacterium]
MTEHRTGKSLRTALALLLCLIAAAGVLSLSALADDQLPAGTDGVGRLIISSAENWETFAARVNAGENGLNAIMDADVVLPSDATLVGTAEYPYVGDFDGNGHTLTYTLTADDYRYGLFSRVNGCSIHDLSAVGTVNTAYRLTGGLVGEKLGSNSCNLNRCRVSVTINSSVV